MAERTKRWSGDYTIVWDDDTWEFFRCCRCGKPLRGDASRKRGLGNECKSRGSLGDVLAVMNAERARLPRRLRSRPILTVGSLGDGDAPPT